MNILVVDDHVMFAESIKFLLGNRYQITTVSDGTAAITQVSTLRPGVILLDLKLPDIDGLTLLKVIRALPEPPPVLLLSGSEDCDLIEQARAAGAVGFLHKSLPGEALIDAIEKVSAGETVWPNNAKPAPRAVSPSIDALSSNEVNSQIVRELGITDRQIDVLQLLVAGLPNKSIAGQLGIAESTVKTHIKSLFQVLKVRNRVACQNRARELGLLQ